MQPTQTIGSHAVVIGASMAGLVAARVLSERYARVSIVERDELPAEPANRRGVPQGRHAHGLLGGGREALEQLYPGITGEWAARGAIPADVTDDVLWCNEGAYHHRFHSGLTGVLLSRPLVEHQVRARTLALPNVSLVEGDVAELSLTGDGAARAVTGVVLRSGEVLGADLVVDASGRGSRALTWLASAGWPVPEEEQVEVNLTYTTRFYRHQSELGDVKGAVVAGSLRNSRSGVVIAQEGDRWVVTLIGYMGDSAPATEDGFLAYARSLPVPEIATVVANAEPLTDFVVSRFACNQRRRFERLRASPDGFLVFGDALCSFNPVYGQGMTVAAMEGLALRACLASGTRALARRFYSAAGKLIDVPWSIAVGHDLRLPQVVGKRTPMVRFINWYMARFHRGAWHDATLALAFQRVANLMAPPPSLLAPRLMRRVWALARGERGQRDVELFGQQAGRHAAHEQQPVDGALVAGQHGVTGTRRNSAAVIDATFAVGAQRVEER